MSKKLAADREPPSKFQPDAIRDEKRKVLRALRPFTEAEVATHTVRGQYRAGVVGGAQVPGYNDEIGRSDDPSSTETFVAIKGEIANWRWGGVPFYLRTGKRLAGRGSEIVVQFRDVPHDIFPVGNKRLAPNRLIIRVQPDEGIRLSLMTKVPGPGADAGYSSKRIAICQASSFTGSFKWVARIKRKDSGSLIV